MPLLSDKNKRVLVTTIIDKTLPKKEPILFLGEWCKGINNNYDLFDHKIAFDLFKLDNNDSVKYLDGLFDRILIVLTLKLNTRHKVNHSVLFWKRLLGSWLKSFLHSQHYHWSMIKHVEASHSIEKTYVIRGFEKFLECKNNMINVDPDLWLHASFAFIIKNYTNIPCQYIEHQIPEKRKFTPLSRKNKYLFFLSKVIFKLKLVSNKSIVILNTSIGAFNLSYIELLCKQFPVTWLSGVYQSIEIEGEGQSKEIRNWTVNIDANTDFDKFLEEILVDRLPANILENYKNIGEIVYKLPLPTHPKNIVLGDWPKSQSILLRWVVETLEKSTKSKLTIIQHGGNYGMDKYYVEKFDLSISDTYLSWGWGKKSNKVIPMFYHKKYYKYSGKTVNGRLTLVSLDIQLLPINYNSFSVLAYKKFLLEDLDQFIKNIDSSFLDSVWLRGFKNDTGIYNHYLEKYPNIHIDKSCGVKGSVKNAIELSKLFVITYNSTFVQEAILSNVPVVIFWTSDLFSIREEYAYCFSQMRDVGMFHDSPKSAALHINSIWHDVDSWWNSHATQRVRLIFCEQFARTPVDYSKLTNTLMQ